MVRHVSLVLALAVLAAGCNLKAPTTPRPKASAAAASAKPLPATGLQVKQVGDVATLTGKVKIISDNGGGIISDNGGGIISNNSGNIIGNNGGSIIGNNGGSLVSNNGGNLTGKTKRRILAAPAAREYLLADAEISFYDAAGRQLQDGAGKPITATTDASGNYALKAVLPPGNLVMRIKVHNGGVLVGGELSAMLVPDGQHAVDTAIDTVSSLGAAYVLGKYVGGSQQTYDKLPASEAERLRRVLDGASGQLAGTPKYAADALVAATEDLRAKAPGVDKTLKDIQALLLGQANLGDGQQATDVALFRPDALAPLPDGSVMVGEPLFGRIRKIGPDGTITTVADLIHGTAKRNFPRLSDLKRGPDGSLFVAVQGNVYRLAPDGATVTTYAGLTRNSGTETATGVAMPAPAGQVDMHPARIAVGAEGTLYVGEISPDAVAARVIAVDPQGQAREVPLPGFTPTPGWFGGIQVMADGTLYMLWTDKAVKYRVLRLKPGGTVEELGRDFMSAALNDGAMVVAEDGTVYVAEQPAARVTAIAPDGTRHVVCGAGGPEGRTDLSGPRALALEADGTLLVADNDTSLVHALAPDGRWYVRAGTLQHGVSNGTTRALTFDAPEGAAFDDRGGLLIGETGGNAIRRYDGSDVLPFAGTGRQGYTGDGGPAVSAGMSDPTGIGWRNGKTYVIDGFNHAIRMIAADGTISTIAGNPGATVRDLTPGQRIDAKDPYVDGTGLAVDAAGQVYWTTTQAQVMRLAKDGKVELVAGKPHGSQTQGTDAGTVANLLDPGMGDGGPASDASFLMPTGLAFDAAGNLYIADTGACRIRKVTGLDGAAPTIGTFAGLNLTQLTALEGGDPMGVEGAKANETPLSCPAGLAFDAGGTLYVGELGTIALPLLTTLNSAQLEILTSSLPAVSARVRKILPDGTIHTIAGPRGKFFPDPQREDGLVLPAAICVAPDGRLAIVDTAANLVRILPAGSY